MFPVAQTGGRVRICLNEPTRDDLDERLRFCAFDNGADDLVYVGVNYGMWSRGEFDLSFDGEVIYTGLIVHLLHEGALLNMGDVLRSQPRDGDLTVTRVTGWFK